jgi:carboxyl-terminal processing protease
MRYGLTGPFTFLLLPAAFVVIVLLLSTRDPVEAEERWQNMTREEVKWLREARSLILRNYVEEIDSRRLVYSAMKGMVESLDDYSTFYFPEDEQDFQEKTLGEYQGIGSDIDWDGGMFIKYPGPGSPAEKAGLLPGDRILEIDGRNVIALGYRKGVSMIKGPRGTSCRLLVRRPSTGKTWTVEVLRDVICTTQIFMERIVRNHPGIGYLRLKGFHRGTGEELTAAIGRLKSEGAEALIVDLRFNYGGLLDEALSTTNLFLGEGILLHTRGRAKQADNTLRADPKRLRFPRITLVLLVNYSTVSAAEVFAGTLQDRMRAVVVGNRTFGKGVVQTAMTMHFGEDVVIKMTTARYFTPLGRCIEKKIGNNAGGAGGIEPDYTIPMDPKDVRELKKFISKRDIPTPYLADVIGVEEAERPLDDCQFRAALSLLLGEKIFSPLPVETGR